jgi:tape measure domain-containing protein
MAGNQRETKLTLRVEALGQDELKSLQDGLSRLAKEGGDAAPEFQRLADEVGRLGDQAGTLASFEKLAATTAELTQKQQQAEVASSELKTKLDEQRASVTAAAAAQEQASQAYQQAKNRLTEISGELKILRTENDATAKKTDDYKASVSRLVNEQTNLRKSLDDLRSARSQANQGLDQAEKAEARLQAAYQKSQTAVDASATALSQSKVNLDAARTATEALGLSTTDVAGSQAKLVAALNATGAAADLLSADMQEAARYVKFWGDALDESDRKAQQTAAAATEAGQKIATAFGTVGIRGAQELEGEIAQVRAAMDTLKNQAGLTGGALSTAMAAGNAKIKELERELRAATGTLTTADKAAKLFSNSMGQIAAGNVIADGVGYLVNKVKELGREFIDTTVQTEQFRRGLDAIYKNTATTAQQMQFLRSTANANGVSIGALSEAFVRYSAATKSANIPLQVTNELFASVTRTAGTLGLSAEAVGGTLDALGQIASKGVVSLEELRQQLGDRMPGALSAAAKGLGLTDAELIKLVESGNLAARDFFPAFSKGLQEMQGQTEGLIPTWNRLKNAMTIATQNAGDAGGLEVMTGALKLLGAAVGIVVGAITGFIEIISVSAKSIGILLSPAGTLADKFKAIGEAVDEAAARQAAFSASIDATLNPVQQAASQTAALSTATAALTAAAAAAGPQWDTLTRSQQASAIATQIASDKSRDLSAQLVATNSAISTLLATQAKETEALGKVAKAVKEEGDTRVALAKLRGDEKGVLTEAAAAAEAYAVAQDKVAASRNQELALLTQQRDLLIATRTAQGESADAIAKQTVEIDKKIVASKAEADQSKASAEAARLEAAERKISAETYGDQSKRAAEFKAELERLNKTLAEYQRLAAEGKKTDADVAAIRLQLATTTAKYKDALNDAAEASRLEAQAKSLNLQATMSSKNSEVELYQAKAQSARASGDLRMATYYEGEAKRVKIEADKISIQIKEIELKLEREEIQLKLEKAKLEEPENANRQKELELRLKLNDIKTKELDSSRELLRIKESERVTSGNLAGTINNESGSRNANAGAIGNETSALEQSLSVREKDIELREKELQLRDREAALSKQGSASMTSDIATRTGILNFLKQAGVDNEAVAKQLANEFADQNGNVVYSNNPGQIKYGGKYGTLSEALLKAAETYTFRPEALQGSTTTASNTKATTTTPAATTATPATTASQSITITVKTPNGSKQVNVQSQSDAAALEAILREFETAAGTAA